MTGFIPSSQLSVIGKAALPLVAQCNLCKLDKGSIHHPKMKPSGEGRKRILILGEAPEKADDEEGTQFFGKSGQLLSATLVKFDVDMRRDCWLTNAAICHPKGKLPEKAVDHCRPNLVKTLEELRPKVVIPLGQSAIKSLIGWLWRPNPGQMSRWDGFQIPSQKLNAWVCPTFDPKHVLQTGYGSQKENEVRTLLFEWHLKAACKLKGRPWKEMLDWENWVRVILEPDRAAKEVRKLAAGGRPVAWDFETDRLKPDHRDARVVCCSVSDGRIAVAFPWHGEAVEATRELLAGHLPKIGSNIKFEQRWCLRFGIKVRNWAWDTMLAAHAIDNRQAISGIEFQAFVLLGVPPWDEGVGSFLEAKNANSPNRIAEVPLPRLLRYNALDSLYEWHVARRQAKIMGTSVDSKR